MCIVYPSDDEPATTYYTVYEIVNTINNRKYVGVHRTKNIFDSYLGSGTLLKLAFNKYGKENFRKHILVIFNNELDMLNAETIIVDKEFVARPDTYNITVGGGYPPDGTGVVFSEERKRKIGNSKRGEKHHYFGKKRSLEHRRQISESSSGEKHYFYGKKHTEESKQRMSASHTGKKLSDEHIRRRVESRKGYTHSAETLRKIGEGNRGKVVSAEARRLISTATSGNNNHNFGKHWSVEIKAKIAESNRGYIWITDGTLNQKIRKEEVIPEGWNRGMTKKYKTEQ